MANPVGREAPRVLLTCNFIYLMTSILSPQENWGPGGGEGPEATGRQAQRELETALRGKAR